MRNFIILSLAMAIGAGVCGAQCDFYSIAGGSTHTIALKSDGTVWTFGYNNLGTLGDGTNTSRNTPVQVVGPGGVGYLTDIIAIAGDGTHTIALKSDGTVWAWGANGYFQLGDGTNTHRNTPVQVVGTGGVDYLTDIIAIACGELHTVALKSDSTVWTWGNNEHGELGDCTNFIRNTPVQVVGPGGVAFLTDIIAIAGGSWHTIALKSDSTVWTFGRNDYGQLGDGTNTPRNTPVQVVGPGGVGYLKGIIAIAGGYWHTIALKSIRFGGTVWAWGGNGEGQLGDGTNTNRNTPVQVVGSGGIGYLTDIIAIAGGFFHTITLKYDGTGWTFGLNWENQLGDGTNTNRNAPVQVVGTGGVGYLTDIGAIAGGGRHTITLKSDAAMWTFGRNNYGQLGDGTNIDRNAPVEVHCEGIFEDKDILPDALAISAFPNPFNSSVAIAAPAGAEVEIYDLRGNVVYSIPSIPRSLSPQGERDDAAVGAGGEGQSPSPSGEGFRMRGFTWTPDQTIASGIYLVRASLQGQTIVKRIIYLK